MEQQVHTLPAERRQLILNELEKSGAVRVESLGRVFAVSEMTIRRDLDALEAEGRLERTHGGALALQTVASERPFHEKGAENREAKSLIGERASALVSQGETVLVNSGSTTREVIHRLARRKGIRIVTNNTAAVAELPADSQAEVFLIGGLYRPSTGCTVGDWTAEVLETLAPSRAILGVDGISLKEGLTSPDPREAAVTRLMIARTRGAVTIVADSAKIGRVCAFRSASAEAIDQFVTHSQGNSPWLDDFRQAGVDVVLADTD